DQAETAAIFLIDQAVNARAEVANALEALTGIVGEDAHLLGEERAAAIIGAVGALRNKWSARAATDVATPEGMATAERLLMHFIREIDRSVLELAELDKEVSRILRDPTYGTFGIPRYGLADIA